jgi:hypothetical protein
MLKQLLEGLVLVPFLGVPIALLAWTVFQVFVRNAPLKGCIGLIGGGALCFVAFFLFLANVYCESCADRPLSLQETVAMLMYFGFGVVMLLVLWFTAAPLEKKDRRVP